MTKQQQTTLRPVDGGKTTEARLDRETQLKIGEGLRAMYDDIVKQGVPDRFVDLLEKLDRQEGAKGAEEESRQE